MKRFAVVVVCLFAIVPLQTAEPEGMLLREHWYQSRAAGGKLGWLHFEARAVQKDGKKLIRTVIREDFAYKRSGDPYKETLEYSTLETDAGELVEVGYRTNLSKRQHLTVRGQVERGEIALKVFNEEQPTEFGVCVPAEKGVLGLCAADRFFQGKPLKPGNVLSYLEFNIAANRVLPVTFTVKGRDAVRIDGQERALTRIHQTYPKKAYLGKLDLWVDEQGVIVKQEEDTPSFGAVTYERVTRETALTPFEANVADIEAPIAVNRPLPIKLGLPRELVVRVSMKDEDEPGTLFAPNGRQQIVKADAQAVELRLLAADRAEKKNGPKPSEEYLKSNLFIRSDDVEVVKLAREAVGQEKDPRKQLGLIRKWMRGRFKGNYEVPFATADEVARTQEGDCTEMGVLAAAMCRALSIPSRLVFGLVYDPSHPGFGGHLWTEVYVEGDWTPFDPTGVLDLLNAAYIKIADYSFHNVLSPDELTEVRRAFHGKMKVEVVESK